MKDPEERFDEDSASIIFPEGENGLQTIWYWRSEAKEALIDKIMRETLPANLSEVEWHRAREMVASFEGIQPEVVYRIAEGYRAGKTEEVYEALEQFYKNTFHELNPAESYTHERVVNFFRVLDRKLTPNLDDLGIEDPEIDFPFS